LKIGFFIISVSDTSFCIFHEPKPKKATYMQREEEIHLTGLQMHELEENNPWSLNMTKVRTPILRIVLGNLGSLSS